MRTLLRNGRIHTPDDPGATAVLVEDDRIAWIGHEGAALAQRDGVDADVDLAGALVTPAFVDAHVHVTATGAHLSGLDVTGVVDGADLLRRVAACCATAAEDDIVVGHGWDETSWSDPRLPDRAEIDRAAGGRAVYLTRVDVHSALASSALLRRLPDVSQLAGFSATGPLRSAAHHRARRAILDHLTPAQRARWQRAALDHFAASGIAAVHEMAGPDISSEADLAQLMADDHGVLVTAYWGELDAAVAMRLGAIGAGGDLFADGAIGSHTAFLAEPYSDDPATRGVSHVTSQEVADHVVECTHAGIQAGFHVIGDAALAEVLAGIRSAAAHVGIDRIRAARHRLEHVEMPDSAALADLAELGITASMQPQFDELWGGPDGMYERRLGPHRAATMNPFATIVTSGTTLAFGSDTPVTTPDPWRTVAAAVFHHRPEQRLTARAAFNAHTRGGWRAIGVDDAGVLRPGAMAHLAVWETGELTVQAPDERIAAWSTDPSSGTPLLPELTAAGTTGPPCVLTIAAGRIIHDRDGLVPG